MSTEAGPTHRWTTHDQPDFLVLQPAPAPAIRDGRPVDVLRELLGRRGFAKVEPGDDLGLRPARGCLLTRGTDGEVALLVTLSETAGATRFVLPGLDASWWERAVSAEHAAVLVSTAAVSTEGVATRDDLRADIEAGGVVAALVPTGSLARRPDRAGRS